MKKLTHEHILFLLVLVSYIYFIQDFNANINTRLDLTWSIVDYKTFSIDAYHSNTDDKALRAGHFYSDKAPGVSLLGVPVYLAVKPVLLFMGYKGWDLRRTTAYFIRIVTVSFPSAILCIFLFRLLTTLAPGRKSEAFLLCLFYAFGTLAFPYSTLFYSHQTAAALAFMSFYLMQRNTHKNSELFLAGFLAALCAVTEYTAFVLLFLLLFYAALKILHKKSIIFFLAGSIFPLSLLGVYHTLCFGSPFLTGYNFEVTKAYAEAHASGLFGISFPQWDSFTGMLFSPRGLFTLSPFLVFAFPGFIMGIKHQKYNSFRAEIIFSLLCILSFFYINASYYKWWGGWGIGPRFLIPVLPFFITGCFIFLSHSSTTMRKLFLFAALYSILVISLCTIIYPQVPEDKINPLMDFIIPNAIQGRLAFNLGRYFSLHGYATLLPLLFFYAALYGALRRNKPL